MEQTNVKQVITNKDQRFVIAESKFELRIDRFYSVPKPFTSMKIAFPEIDAVW